MAGCFPSVLLGLQGGIFLLAGCEHPGNRVVAWWSPNGSFGKHNAAFLQWDGAGVLGIQAQPLLDPLFVFVDPLAQTCHVRLQLSSSNFLVLGVVLWSGFKSQHLLHGVAFGLDKQCAHRFWVLLGRLTTQNGPVFLGHGVSNQFQDVPRKKFAAAVRREDADLIGFVLSCSKEEVFLVKLPQHDDRRDSLHGALRVGLGGPCFHY